MANGADFSFLKKLGIGGAQQPNFTGTAGYGPSDVDPRLAAAAGGPGWGSAMAPSTMDAAAKAGKFDDIFNSQLASGIPDMLAEFGKRPETYASDATGQSGQPGMENFEALDPGGGWAGEYAPSGYKDLIADPSIEGYSPNYKKRKRYT